MIPEEKYEQEMKDIERTMKMEEANYVRVLGILHKDMFEILEAKKKCTYGDTMGVLQKMASQISRAEISIGMKLIAVVYSEEKNKFRFSFDFPPS
jgi:hypothetical protein